MSENIDGFATVPGDPLRLNGLRQHPERLWELLYKEPDGGHRLWREVESCRVAIADLSGDGLTYEHRNRIGTPDDTDDGPVWIPHPPRILLTQSSDSNEIFVSLPMLRDDGGMAYVGVTPRFAVQILTYVPAVRVEMHIDLQRTRDLARLIVASKEIR